MRTALRFLLVVTGCLHLCGGHYGILQLIAWSQMLVDYSAENGFIEGAIRTFDGEHPCDLCVSIREAKSEQKDQPANGNRHSELELKNLLAPEPVKVDPLAPREPSSVTAAQGLSFVIRYPDDPATPPPRECRALQA